MPRIIPFVRTTLQLAATGAAVLLAGSGLRAQPPGMDLTEMSQADIELRKRLQPLLPSVRAALEGNNPDAQRAALGIAADFPPGLATGARLPAVVAAFLQRDGIDPELSAMGLRAYGRMVPTVPDQVRAYVADLSKVARRHIHSESVDVRRATAEALATSVQNSAPARKSLADAGAFIEVAGAALPLQGEGLADRDPMAQRGFLEGVAGAARVVTDIYTFDAGPGLDEPAPKEGTSRFDQLRPVVRGLAASIPQMSKPLSARDPATRLSAGHALETLALTRRTVINSRPVGEPAPTDPFPDAWASLRPVLAERVVDPDPQVRLATVQAMETLGEGLDTRELLRQATADRAVFVRWATARALGRSAPPKPTAAAVADDVAALARLTADPDPDVRTAALNALARFGPAAKSVGPAVLAAASRGDVEPRVAAVKALAALETDAAATVPVLIAGLEDKDLRLRRVAAAGLTRFGPDAKAALPELRKAVLSDDPELRLSAAEAILAIERVPKLREL